MSILSKTNTGLHHKMTCKWGDDEFILFLKDFRVDTFDAVPVECLNPADLYKFKDEPVEIRVIWENTFDKICKKHLGEFYKQTKTADGFIYGGLTREGIHGQLMMEIDGQDVRCDLINMYVHKIDVKRGLIHLYCHNKKFTDVIEEVKDFYFNTAINISKVTIETPCLS